MLFTFSGEHNDVSARGMAVGARANCVNYLRGEDAKRQVTSNDNIVSGGLATKVDSSWTPACFSLFELSTQKVQICDSVCSALVLRRKYTKRGGA